MRPPKKLLVTCSGLLAASLLLPSPAAALPIDVLVNKQHPVQPLSLEPEDLSTPFVRLALPPDDPEMQLRAPASHALEKMFQAAAKENISLVLSSGYRSYTQQSTLYQQALFYGGAAANEAVARPGYSEHQTGLAADIITSDYICAAQGCFTVTRASAWLQNNSCKYGFIQRYPDYKQPLTSYEYEPWHYRYVGSTLARKLYQNQQTLDEYSQQHAVSVPPQLTIQLQGIKF